MRPRRANHGLRAIALAAITIVAAACSSPTASTGAGFPVVASTTVFADLVRNVAGPDAQVDSIVPAGADVHTFDPTPRTIVKVGTAKVIVMNGLGLDDWLDKIIANADGVAPTKLGDLANVQLIPGQGGPNPHLWMSVGYAEGYVDEIEAALAKADPSNAPTYAANAAAYKAKLADLDDWVKQQIATVPEPDRRIVTFHDAFPYFARAYGLEIVGVAVDAPGQEPSAAEIGNLIDAIRQAHVKAIFAEVQYSPKLVEQIAAETGATVVTDLYDDSLGDPPVTSYEQVIRWDVTKIVDALK